MFKKTLLLSFAASSLLATNGVNMIGTTAASRAMGGTGIAYYTSAAGALHKNISLMGDIDKSEFQFDITYFSASVTSSVYDKMPLNANLSPLPNLPSYDGPAVAESQNMMDTNYIPSISYATRLSDKTVLGIAMIGAAGMATQYEGEYAQRQMNSSMMLMKIIPGLSYRQGNTTFGFAPVLGFGSMSLNYDDRYLDPNGTPYPYGTKPQSQREGLFGTNIGGSELVPAFGFTAGMDVKVTERFRVGVTYNSSLKYTYKEVANFSQFGPSGMVYMADEWMYNNAGVGLSGDNSTISSQLMAAGFKDIVGGQLAADAIQALAGTGTIKGALEATDPNKLDDLTLEQPWEVGIGFAYDVSEDMSCTFDYRYIAWGLAEGYKDFGWDNQSVFAFGIEYHADEFQIRAGYNYAASPIAATSGEAGALLTDVQGHLIFDQALSMLNMVGFPAISTTHFSGGVGYAFSDDMDLDFTVVYSPEATTTREGSLSPLTTGFDALDMVYSYQTKMEQLTLSFGINYQF